MIVVDTGGVLAFVDDRDPHHARVRTVVEREPGPLLLSPFVLAELDYLIAKRVGSAAQLAILREVAAGAYTLVPIGTDAIDRVVALLDQYRDLEIGLADASVVLLAERYETTRLLTLDERHFRTLTRFGEPFVLLPADAD